MKVLASLVVLFSVHAFAANTAVYKVVVGSKTTVSLGADVETLNGATPVTIALDNGYGEYLEQQDIHGRTLYRTLVVSGVGHANCSITATVLWDNGTHSTGVVSCDQLKAQKSLQMTVGDVSGERTYSTTYIVYSEE